MNLRPDADARLNDWLTRTEAAMRRSELDSDEITEVIVDLRSHIAEELQRFGSGPHDRQTLESVLSTMDGPGAWESDAWESEVGLDDPQSDAKPDDASLLGSAAALTVIVGLVGALIIGQTMPDGDSLGFTFFCAAEVVAGVMGYVARSNKWGRFALIAGPLLVVLTFVIAILFPEG